MGATDWTKTIKIVMRKIESHLKWFFAVIPVGIVGAITAPIFYPFAQVLDLISKKYNPLTWWMDDEINHSATNEDWIVFCKGKQWNLIKRYQWHAFRNTLWNLKNKLKVKNARLHGKWNDEIIIQTKIDDLWRDGNKLDTTGVFIEMASAKYKAQPGEDPWQKNSGDELDIQFSTFGTSELWYEAQGELYYRYSTMRVINIFGNKFVLVLKMGASEKRYLLTLKLISIKKFWITNLK